MLNAEHKFWFLVKKTNNNHTMVLLTCEFEKDRTFTLEFHMG